MVGTVLRLYYNTIMKHLGFIFCLACVLLVPSVASAETYIPLTNIPGLSSAADTAVQGDFTSLINVVYKVAIGLSAALAVLFLIFEGVRYSASVIPGVKTQLRERMTTVIGGMALLLCAYILLEVVNPSLTKIDDIFVSQLSYEDSENFEINESWNLGSETDEGSNKDTGNSTTTPANTASGEGTK